MIIKCARPYRKVSALAAHLTKDENEQVRFLGGRGVVAGDDLTEALKEMAAQARGSRCQQPLYHIAFNAAPGEHLDGRQWERCLELWEQAAGLEHHQRAVVQHLKEGRWHTHVVYNRLDPDTGLAVNVWQDHYRAKTVARQIERELGLERVLDEKPRHREGQRQAERWEAEQARRTGVNVHEARDAIRQAWEQSDTGRAFQNALEAEGLLLARGERRAFLVVDREGNFYALNGRVMPGEKQATIRDRLSDLDRERLPSLEEARELQQARAQELEGGKGKKGRGDKGERDRALTPDEELTEKYRAQHADLNRQAEREARRLDRVSRKLERAHVDERRHEKDEAPRPWLRVVPVSTRARRRHEEKLLRKEAQREKERAVLEARTNERLSELARQHAELRRREKEERALLKGFATQAGGKEPMARLPQADLDEHMKQLERRNRELEEERKRERARKADRGLDR